MSRRWTRVRPRGLLAILVLAVASASATAQKPALRDGGFEESQATSPGWSHIAPPGTAPAFSYPSEGARSGERCGQIAAHEAGGFTSFTQKFELTRKHRWLRLSAWARLADQSGAGGAWLTLTFAGDDGSDAGLRRSRRLRAPGDWEELIVESTVPDGASYVLVRCGVSGPARARFDDVELVEGSGGKPREDATLLTVHGYWRVSAGEGVREPWVDVSVPLPFAAQTPLALRVDSVPAAAVDRLSVLAERENRPLRVHLAPLEPGAAVILHVSTLVLVRDRGHSDGKGVNLVPASRVPEDLREHLRPSPGIESEDGRILGIAQQLARRDLAEITTSLFEFLKREIASGSGDQGALATLDSGDAACTGHANLGAALLIAAGVPTRVLACVLVGSDQQEHYVVESWAKDSGWVRIEPTLKRFRVPDAQHAILRVVYGESTRSAGHVPLFWRSAEGLTFGPDMASLREDGCWQSAQDAGQLAPERSAVEAIEAGARQGFEALVQTSHAGNRLRLAPAMGPEPILGAIDGFMRP